MTEITEQEIIKKLDKISEDISEIKTDIVVIKSRLDGQQKAVDKIPDLAEKVGELKNWRQIAIIIITGTASTVFGWFLKSGRM
ncbi:MAG: hypothetical protein QNJ72_18605 [Pleurocapsa sp. MO_226.B13]|nr:hypothetical protein [Pleurocapsa sp. MO_226.B13]